MAKISNVYKDKKRNSWYFSASLGYDREGKRRQIVKRGFRTQREAKEAYDTFMANNSKEAFQKNSTMLYEEFYNNLYMPDYKSGVSERTFNNRKISMDKHLQYFFKFPLKDISPTIIQKWKNEMYSKYKNGYIRSIYGSLQKSLDFAIKLGLLEENVAKNVGNVKKKQEKPDFWTKEEFEKVVSSFDLNDYYDFFAFIIIYVLFMTGLRIGEAQALEWEDLDIENKYITVNKSMHYINSKDYYTHEPKTKAGNRIISIDDNTLEYLLNWKELQSNNIKNNKYIFSYNGIPMNKSNVSRIIQRQSKVVGVKKIKVHALRHSHASLLISLNEQALVIRDRLGHEDIETTLGTYGHLYPNINHKVADRLKNVIELDFKNEKKVEIKINT